MSDIYDTLSLEEIIAIVQARGIPGYVPVDGDARAYLISLLRECDVLDSKKQHENLTAVRMVKGADILERLASRITVTDEVATSCPECFDTGIKIVNTKLAPSVLKATYQKIDLAGP